MRDRRSAHLIEALSAISISICLFALVSGAIANDHLINSRYELTNLKWLKMSGGFDRLERTVDAEANCTMHNSNCSSCLTDKTGCGYCFSPSTPQQGTCHSGSFRGPDNPALCSDSNIWTTKGCPTNNSQDCSLFDGGCGECVNSPFCGYCEATGICEQGTLSGPTQGSCPKNDWAFVLEECPAVEQCSAMEGNCFGCAELSACGYCSSTQQCLPGNLQGPNATFGVCSSGWTYIANECPGASNCSKENGKCGKCTALPGCGYCAENKRCIDGTRDGPSSKEGVCPEGDWAYDSAECALVPNCTDFYGNCSLCTELEECGYCSATKECFKGSATGPASPNDTCPASSWTWKTLQCPPPSCSQHDGDCAGCTQQEGCGYCATEAVCVDGTINGPTNGSCDVNSWAFQADNCTTILNFCSTYDFTCSRCVSDPGCGFCADDDRCYRGNSTGPLDSLKTGGCVNWLWDTTALPECPASEFDCSQFNGKCQQCGAQPECGYCVTNLMCLNGGPLGPQDMSDCPAGKWDFNGASCPVRPLVNCSTTDGECAECSAREECGFCAGTDLCLPGTKDGPYEFEGTCSSKGWAFTPVSCPVVPYNCSQFAGQCDACNSNPQCGYCLSSGACLRGNKTTSVEGSCPGHSWTFAADMCPVAPFDCAQFDQDCESCTAADPCGYCASSGDCKLGAKSGPANSTCPAGEIDWIFEGEHCSLAFNCTPFGEDCETCTSNEACGYCTATGSCYNGNILGPVFNASHCAHDFWAYTTEECPVPTLPCVQYTSCRQCVLDPFCGYCLSSGCRTGDSAGPTVDSCPDGDWIFNRTTCPAPPALGSVILADDGAAIYVTFDEPTNRANYYGLFPCSVLVANASILGSNPVCYWQNSLVLVIRLGRDASFAIGEDLTFLPYLIASAGSNDTQNDSNFLTAPISPAINPNSPVVGIEGTALLASCDTVVLDGSNSYGSGAREWVGGYRWTVSDPLEDSADLLAGLQGFLENQTGAVVSFPASQYLFANRPAYKFTLTLTNWFGETSSASFQVTVSVDDDMVVRILGPSKVLTHSNNPISFRSVASPPCICQSQSSLPVCSPSGTVSYAWVRSQGPVFPLDLNTRTSSTLYLPPGSLIGGHTYEFTVSVTLDNSLAVIGRASVTVVVEEDSLIPRISSGDRVLSRFSNITLDGSTSSDPNSLPGTMAYSWACQRIDGFGTACPANTYLSSSQYKQAVVTIPPGALLPGEYAFTLVVSKGTLSASTSVSIVILWEDVPTVSLTLVDETGMNPLFLVPNARVVLEASAFSPSGSSILLSGFKWSFSDGDIPLSTSGVATRLANTSNIYINPDTLTPGAEYTVRLEVTYPTGGPAGVAEISFQMNTAPWGGECSIVSLIGVQFTVQCLGFEDTADNNPLFYHYSFVTPEGADFFLSSHYLQKNLLSTYLPRLPGDITIRARVTNRQGAIAASTVSPAYLVVSNTVITEQSDTRYSQRDTIPSLNVSLVSSAVDVEYRAGNEENVANLLWSTIYDLNNGDLATAAPVAVVQEEALQLTEALPLEVSPYAEWIKLQLFFLISLGQTSTRTISRDITLVSPPVLSEAQDILRNLRLLVQNHALPPPPYDSVTLLLETASKALASLNSADSSSGEGLSSELVGLMNDISAWQASEAIPGTGPMSWNANDELRLLIQRDSTEILMNGNEYVVPGTGVSAFAPGGVGQEFASNQLSDGTFYYFDYNGDLYSWDVQGQEDIISPTYETGFLRADSTAGAVQQPLATPISVTLPVNLAVVAALNVSLDDINLRWGKVCQAWEDSSLSWIDIVAASPSSANVSICATNSSFDPPLSARVQFIVLPPAPGPSAPIPAGPDVDNSENGVTWLLLALLLGLAICGLIALLIGMRFYSKKEESQEELPPTAVKLEKSVPTPAVIALHPASRRTATREIELPSTSLSEPSEILLRPKLAPDGTGRIIYNRSSESDPRRDSFENSDSEFGERGDSASSRRSPSRSRRSDSRSRRSKQASSASRSKSKSRHDTDYSSDEVTDSSEDEKRGGAVAARGAGRDESRDSRKSPARSEEESDSRSDKKYSDRSRQSERSGRRSGDDSPRSGRQGGDTHSSRSRSPRSDSRSRSRSPSRSRSRSPSSRSRERTDSEEHSDSQTHSSDRL